MKKRLFVALGLIAGLAFVTTAAIHAQAPKPPTTVTLKASFGNVTFDHAKHSKLEGVKCDLCHHASKSEKPAKAPQEKCTDCHTSTATPPMKTKLQAAFHDPMAKKGLCVDCHVKETAAGKKGVPAKCNDCHKKKA